MGTKFVATQVAPILPRVFFCSFSIRQLRLSFSLGGPPMFPQNIPPNTTLQPTVKKLRFLPLAELARYAYL